MKQPFIKGSHLNSRITKKIRLNSKQAHAVRREEGEDREHKKHFFKLACLSYKEVVEKRNKGEKKTLSAKNIVDKINEENSLAICERHLLAIYNGILMIF